MVAPMLQACRAASVRKLLFVSTAAVYRPGPTPAREDDAPAPLNAYGRSKAAAEAVLMAQADCPVTILRLGNIAGADALLGPRGAGEIVLDPVPGQIGGPLRSWIGPKSLAQVLAALCRAELPNILNIACDPPLPMADLLTASGLPWRFGPPNPAVVPVATLATTRLAELVDLPGADPATLAAEAAWARGVLA